jgi:VWFA-related protein
MHRVIFILTAIVIGSLAASAQIAAPTPPADEGEVVKISTSLIQLDLSVTDKKGNPITDIRADEVELYENGEKQKISGFTFISGSAPGGKPEPASLYPEPIKSVKPEAVRRSIAIVVDDISLGFDTTAHTRKSLKQFIDEEMRPGDLVAIIRTGSGVGALQQFTTDKKVLHAAVERIRWKPLFKDNLGAFMPFEARDGNDAVEDFQNDAFAAGTLGALRFVINGMSQLPGRKSVILFSHGFRVIGSRSKATSGNRASFLLDGVVDQANRASVVIYAIDPRGLYASSPIAILGAVGPSDRSLFESQAGLRLLAEETGGFAITNSNGFAEGIRNVLRDQSYYLIGYEPSGDTFDPDTRRYNRIEIKVNRPGANVRYRSGFFNVTDEDRRAAMSAKSAEQQVLDALTSPFAANEITLNFNPLFGYDEKVGTYVRSLLHVKGDEIKLSDGENGSKIAEFTLLAASFGDNGVIADQHGKNYKITLSPSEVQRLRETGFVYEFIMPIKQPGGYQFRVAMRDNSAGTLGSASEYIEIPNIGKKRLTLSSIALERAATPGLAPTRGNGGGADPVTDSSRSDSSLRRFAKGASVTYGLVIYNAKYDRATSPDLVSKVRLIHEGAPVFEGEFSPIAVDAATDPQGVVLMGALTLGKNIPAGDYILQIVVSDRRANNKYATAVQATRFEVSE